MIDVNKITSTLAKLPDAQLQQYAQMHKADPYIMALALSESNRRKEMRSAGQGAQGMQEQPKVVDRMLAEMGGMQEASPEQMARLSQMLEARKQAEYEEFTGGRQAQPAPQQLPEEMGIGQLPAGEMNFAGGGIVAFADGGDVERYQVGGSIQDRYRQESMEMGTGARRQYSPDVQEYAKLQAQPSQAEQQAFRDEQQRMLAGGRFNAFPALPTVDAQPTKPAAAPAATRVTPTFSPADLSGMDRRLMTGSQQPTIQSISPPAKPPVAAPRADTTQRSLSGAPATQPAAPATADKDVFGLEALQATQKKLRGNDDYEIGALRNQLVEIKNRAETQAQSAIDARKAELAAEGDVYKDRSDRLVERATKLKGQEGKNTGLALLNAGLAIMSTPGSLATAIGKGAQVGTAQYAAGIKDLRAAQERLDEANDRISDLRLNRKDMNAKEIRSLERERDAALRDGEKMVFGFAEKVYGLKRKDADSLFTSYMSGQEKKADIQSRERISANETGAANARSAAQIAATLNTPDRVLFDQLMKKNDNDAVKALEAFKVAKGDKFDVRSSYADYLKAFAGKEGLTPPMSMGAYAGQFGATLPR